VGTNDSPNNPPPSSDLDPSDRTLTTGGPGGPAAGQIGPYRLLQMLGEGGMGEVWLAEQKKPIQRTVALKLIKAGMDTKAVVARFESERQALALMDHTCIARVFDAGSTPEGRPYFVMEYVPGLPITEYCDKHKLTVKERLELFMQVCDGVQHAHQKAIIHRDLKPSNVLVVEQDNKAVPKIIDFGLAKAMAQRLTDKTMFTEIGVMMGTPEYMSPEQADQSELNVDTRTDVYSLGVILYQLLVGVLPLEAKALRSAGMEAILRAIREQEPPTPSNRIRSMGPASSITAANRKEAPQSFARHLQGELDWITMKALEKDRNRRYSSPSDLSADIQRHLHNEPVIAHPPSAAYRAAKYFRRHRLAVSAAAAGVVLLAGFVMNQAIQLRRITRERDRADRITEFMTNMFKVSDPNEARGNSVTAREILDKASKDIDTGLANDPQLQAQMMKVMGDVYKSLGLYPRAQPLLERSADVRRRVLGPRNPDTLVSMSDLAWVLQEEGHYAEAEKLYRETLTIQRRVLGPEHTDSLSSMSDLALVLHYEGHDAEADKLYRETLDLERRVLGPENPKTLAAMNNLAIVLSYEGHYAEAEKLDRERLDIQRRVLGPEHLSTLASMSNLAIVLDDEGHYAEAEKLDRETLDIQLRVLGPDHPGTLDSMTNLAIVLYYEGHYAEVEKLDRETLGIRRRVLGPDHPRTLGSMNALAVVLQREGHDAEAEKLQQETLNIQRRVLGPEHPATLGSMTNLAAVLCDEGHYAEAEKLQRETLNIQRRVLEPEHPDTLESTANLAYILQHDGHYAEAEKLQRETLDIDRRVFGPEHPGTLALMNNLGETLRYEGRYAEAEKLEQQTLDIQRRVLGPGHPDTASVVYNLGCLAAHEGNRTEALSLLRQALDEGLSRSAALGLEKDPDLKSLHGDPRFEALVAKARQPAAAKANN
jgi:serine/threonine protein kinase/Tfp pilus assembly protein PilF